MALRYYMGMGKADGAEDQGESSGRIDLDNNDTSTDADVSEAQEDLFLKLPSLK